MDQRPPRIAVIIPLYNGAEFIREALHSALRQTFRPHEIIIVDDGSTDNGPAVVAAIATATPAPIRLYRKPNGGQSSARNLGIKLSKSELIALLDQDDVWYPDHIEVLVKPFLRAPQLGWTYGNLDEIDRSGRMQSHSVLRRCGARHPKRDLRECLRTDMFILPSASLIRRSAFDAVGGFDETLSGYEDDDLFLRLFRAGYENFFINRAVTQWRIYSTSSSFTDRMRVSRMRYFRKLVAMFPDKPDQDVSYVRELLVPRFLPWLRWEYNRAVRLGDPSAIRAAVADLAYIALALPIETRPQRDSGVDLRSDDVSNGC